MVEGGEKLLVDGYINMNKRDRNTQGRIRETLATPHSLACKTPGGITLSLLCMSIYFTRLFSLVQLLRKMMEKIQALILPQRDTLWRYAHAIFE